MVQVHIRNKNKARHGLSTEGVWLTDWAGKVEEQKESYLFKMLQTHYFLELANIKTS